jgi:hypothetical protein
MLKRKLRAEQKIRLFQAAMMVANFLMVLGVAIFIYIHFLSK